ncbi:DUF2818 family protein [Chitinivorax sp. PXF-14]|uniref:DUF2818 family protein n=1 Tax=Chitinivorax sp. PXF-14 TaxID=3230488 RepID=UPI0034657929
MNLAALTLLLAAIVAANLPFLSDRIFFLKLGGMIKNLAWRLAEWVFLYFCCGVVAGLLEGRFGPPHDQHWQFYAVTFFAFLIFSLPGFVMKYLWQKPSI